MSGGNESEAVAFEGWAIVEIMGHRLVAGFVTEQQLAGAGFLRLDIVGPDTKIDEDDGPEVALKGGFEGGVTQFYSPSSVYCLTPTTQDIAVRLGRQHHPAPVSRYELEPSRPARGDWDYTDDDGGDDDAGPF